MKAGHGLGGLLMRQYVDGRYGDRKLTWGGGLTFAWFIDRKSDLCGIGAAQDAQPVNGELIAQLKQVFCRDIYRKRTALRRR